MDSVDPPRLEAPSTSIRCHRGGNDHDDPVGLETLLISIWSPYARFVSKWYSEDQELQICLKSSDQVVQKVIQGNEEAAPSPTKTGVSILKSIVGEISKIDGLPNDSYAITSPSSVFAGEVPSLIDSVLQNLNDIHSSS
ncbi:hypothetical protein ACH5RR_034497 [Cinchona calisaya]|uniref:Uncharacterized protein n=1 Tax=Cinchona calisaya TaxID=153742 RepID=A0ABD2YD87_9GENT